VSLQGVLFLREEERWVIDLFATRGVVLERIPESKRKSPDFSSTRGGKLSFFELKTRLGDADLWKKKETLLNSGHAYTHGGERNIETGNKKAALYSIEEALKQLQSARKNHPTAYGFIILQLCDIHSKLTEERWVKTLYGMGDITYQSPSGGMAFARCHSLHSGSFFTYRNELDGVFFVQNDTASFLPNPYSPHSIKLDKGKMFRLFPKYSPIIKEERIFELPPSSIDRSTMENTRLLEEKYGIRVISLLDFNRDYISLRSRQ
jgi:hypothetical protein